MRALRLAWAFFRRDLLTEVSYRANFLFGMAGGIFSVLLFFFLSQVVEQAAPGLARYRGGYFPFVLLGLAVNAFLGEALTGFSRRIRQAQMLGTLEAILATPIRPGSVVAAQALYPIFGAGLRASVYMAFGMALFPGQMNLGRLPVALLALALGVASLAALGILSASATMVLKRGDPVGWALGALSLLLSGVYYPVEILPRELQVLSNALPMTHTLRAMREALLGEGGAALHESLGALALFCLVLVPVAFLVFGWAVRRAQREGSLTHF